MDAYMKPWDIVMLNGQMLWKSKGLPFLVGWCDYVKKTSMDEIVHCDELWCTILNDNGTITTFEMFNHSFKNGWLWCQ